MNPSTQASTVSQMRAGGIPPPHKQEWRKYALYSLSLVNVGAAANASGTIQLDNEAPFYAMQITADVFTGAAPPVLQANAPVTLQITDGQANIPLFNVPVNIGQVSGNGTLPYVLPIPYAFLPAASIGFAVVNNFNAAVTVTVSLHGFRRFISQQAGSAAA